jgi:hypothetical protein
MFGSLISGGLGLLGGILGGNSAEDAANTQAAAQERAAQLAAEEARFRPVGITTRFGSSQFQTGPDGRVSGASYELNPELRALQDRFLGLTSGGVTQAEQAQQQFAPLQGAAQGLFGLGQQYLAQSPEQAAQQYMAGQQNLLAPSREREFAQLQNRLFNTGRGGLSVGATGARPSGAAGLGATTPEMEAYYNAVAQQDAALAAQAQQAGMDQARFGAGLFATGGNLLTQGYGGQAAALDPYKAYLAGATGLEALGQQPLELGSALGGRIANPAGANALYQGGVAAAGSNAAANAYNPFATALVGASRDPRLTDAFGRMFGNTNSMGNTVYNPATGVGGFGGTPNSSFFYGTGGSGD